AHARRSANGARARAKPRVRGTALDLRYGVMSMELTYAQKEQIYERGYVKVPGVVPRVMVDAALRAINHSVGQGMDPEQMTKFRSQSYCPELQHEPVITGLLMETPAWRLAESAIGEGKIRPARGGQIAIRFPSLQDPPP